ncbi:MAG TPA: hypothetical protein EYG68_12700 [Leucothrix mucor]|nr:hypothetical protein [Leucothrix mucor]
MLNTHTLALSTVVLSVSLSACSMSFPRLSSQFKGMSQVPVSPQKKSTQAKIMPQKSAKKTPTPQVIKTAKRKPTKTNYLPRLNDAEATRLFQTDGGFSAYVTEIARGTKTVYKNSKFTEKPLKTLRSPIFRKAILSTRRGKALTGCQFIGLQIEIDGKKHTSDWLVTTKGKGRCGGRPRYFWIIQQDKVAPAEILLAGRADEVSVIRWPEKSRFNEIYVNNSGRLKIKDDDKLADGSWVQVKSSDNGSVQIACKNRFRLEGKRYQSYEGSVEASVNSAMSHGKSWQPVSNPRYRCHF